MNFVRQRGAIHIRHVHIQDGQVKGVAAAQPLQGFMGRAGLTRQHAPFFGLQDQDAPVGGIIIHDEQAFPGQVRLLAAQVVTGGQSCHRLSFNGKVEG